MSGTLILPDTLSLDSERWLDEVEAGVLRLEATCAELPPMDAASLRAAIADVRTSASFARRMFAGTVSLGSIADDHWVPLAKPSPELAAAVHSVGFAFAQTPSALLEQAKALLEVDTYKAFSLEVGYVLASIFTNLFRAVWDDYPEHAPAGWHKPK